jgi:hypothetical protein
MISVLVLIGEALEIVLAAGRSESRTQQVADELLVLTLVIVFGSILRDGLEHFSLALLCLQDLLQHLFGHFVLLVVVGVGVVPF